MNSMERRPIVFFAVLFCVCLSGKAQKGHFPLFRKEGGVRFVTGLFPQNRCVESLPVKQPSPLLLHSTDKKQEQDLFNKIIHWDCRIKFRLSSSLNLVVSYW